MLLRGARQLEGLGGGARNRRGTAGISNAAC